MSDSEEISDDNSLSSASCDDDSKEDPDSGLVSDKSKGNYNSRYKLFVEWRKKYSNTKDLTEDVLLAYFKELSDKNYLPSTLWSIYSILKTMLKEKENFDITGYLNLNDFLKEKSRGFKSKKALHLTAKNVSDFLNNAPDYDYLASKVLLIFGIAGGCKNFELQRIKITDVKDYGQIFRVNVPHNSEKNKITRTFTINEEFHPIVQKYIKLRPKYIPSLKFFIGYRNGKCNTQNFGKSKFSIIPKQIAAYLHLPDAELYTGHCYRQSSAIIRASTCRNLVNVKSNSATQIKRLLQLEPCSYLPTKDGSVIAKKGLYEKLKWNIINILNDKIF